MSGKLFKYRTEIDKIDDRIVDLLSKRFFYVNKIGILKQQNSVPIIDNDREETILKRLCQLDDHSIGQEHIRLIFDAIFKISKDIQKI